MDHRVHALLHARRDCRSREALDTDPGCGNTVAAARAYGSTDRAGPPWTDRRLNSVRARLIDPGCAQPSPLSPDGGERKGRRSLCSPFQLIEDDQVADLRKAGDVTTVRLSRSRRGGGRSAPHGEDHDRHRRRLRDGAPSRSRATAAQRDGDRNRGGHPGLARVTRGTGVSVLRRFPVDKRRTGEPCRADELEDIDPSARALRDDIVGFFDPALRIRRLDSRPSAQ